MKLTLLRSMNVRNSTPDSKNSQPKMQILSKEGVRKLEKSLNLLMEILIEILYLTFLENRFTLRAKELQTHYVIFISVKCHKRCRRNQI